MKNKFLNQVGYNTAEITVQSKGREVVLHYHLNDNPVQYMWQEMHRYVNNYSVGISHQLTKQDIVDSLNSILPVLGESKISNNPTQQDLNELHNKFVNNQSSDQWQTVNLLIHQMENCMNDDGLEKYTGTIRFFAEPEPTYSLLKEEHKLWLTTDRSWGLLLAGYATKGKGWWEISRDDDSIDDLNVQTQLGSETLMIFEPSSPIPFNVNNRFYKWMQNTTHKVPTNISELALGRYLLGNIIITDTFLSFNSNASDWYVPNHKCKLLWSEEFIGKDAIINSVKFFNSDLFFTTIFAHSRMNECIK